MKQLSTNKLRQAFLDFFKDKGHAIIPSASLIPENDPTVLFTTAGMHPLVPYLMGQKHPLGQRLANVQKCLRTGDIEEVGDATHLTFFEMLGNWSLGETASSDGLGEAGYFKKEAIAYSFEFLTSEKYLGLDPKNLFVSVFEGDKDAPVDSESISEWQTQFQKVGIKAKIGEKIFTYNKEKNWWGPVGEIGPCGPCSEMFYDTGQTNLHHPDIYKEPCHPNCSCGRFVEIWNDVFMQYQRELIPTTDNNQLTTNNEYHFISLKQKNVDTGMGLERVAAMLQGVKSVYEIDIFQPIMSALKVKSMKEQRILADHTRAIVFLLADGVLPANEERGYVLRRLIRRSLDLAGDLELTEILKLWIERYQDLPYYPSVKRNKDKILALFKEEQAKYAHALAEGEKIFNKLDKITGEIIFDLRATYGLPESVIKNLTQKNNLIISENEWHKYMELFFEHQNKSRAGAAKKFAGGLAGHSEMEINYHTASHLMNQALRQVLGDHVMQRGSNITPERLRFDFTHPAKMTPEEIKQVEDIVNANIQKNWPVSFTEMSLDEAKESGALGFFEHKYGERVTVYTIGTSPTDYFSKEICGGPHVTHTGKMGHFKITKEEASSAGVRRIKAILE